MRRFFSGRGRWIGGQRLTEAQVDVLIAVFQGWSLRSHRDLEGNKHYEILALDGEKRLVELSVVQGLRRKRLIETNHKFPSATYLLTENGMATARELSPNEGSNPLAARNFVDD